MKNEITMVKIGSHDLYKAIKNYLHNDAGLSQQLSREYINGLIEKAIEHRVAQMFADQGSIRRIVENKIAELVKTGTINRFYNRESFGDIVLGEIKCAVRDHVMSKLDVKIALEGVELTTEEKGEKP